ncbi:MAG: peroxide stress protein YaaA [Saprospiraceae bacterium]
MLILISPAKTLDFESPVTTKMTSEPYFTAEPDRLSKKMRSFSRKKLGELMNISPELAALNVERFQQWTPEPETEDTRQAVLAFSGEVFRGLKADEMSEADLAYAQDHLRILSGLYGLLRPLDRIQPYRLEMGTRLKYYNYKNLYEFWGDKITDRIKEELDESKVIVNLASNEYFKSVRTDQLKARIITPVFKDFSNGEYKILMTYAKNARGAMANFIIKHRITDPEHLKGFDGNGYVFDADQSDENNLVFIRGELPRA